MTLETTTSRQQYTGNAVTTTFSTVFPLLSASHLKVYLGETLQTAGYSVTLSSGIGSVVFTSAPGSGVVVTLLRVVPLTQTLNLVPNASYSSTDLEQSLDYAIMGLQQVQEQLDRSIVLPADSTDDPIQWIEDAVTEAEGYAVAASSSAAAAAGSASDAAQSAVDAASQVVLATAQASAAASSATQAGLSATAAAGSADDADASLQSTLAFADQVDEVLTLAQTYGDNAAKFAVLARKYADYTAMWSTGTPVYDNSTTYNFPDAVVYTDGNIYRCLTTGVVGQAPTLTTYWARINLPITDEVWEIDVYGNLMPCLGDLLVSSTFETDGLGSRVPVESPVASISFDLDANGALQPQI